MSKKKRKGSARNLIADLEAIQTLLSETPKRGKKKARSADAKPIAPKALRDDARVPLLDDRVGDPSSREVPETEPEETVLGDDLFQALLGDDWSVTTAKILEQALESIEQRHLDWKPALSDELVDALKVRIDATVHAWLHTVIVKHAHELHGVVVKALSEEIERSIMQLSDNQNSENADGQ
ncbi:MAG: hypothetical protein O7G86_09380 [Gammaproteobacteria bacterium]|nr:hypothetical protein [Gammaproteobacteria bacterium]